MTTQALRLSPAVTLPVSVLSDVTAIVGRRGRGKTVTAKRMVEEAHRLGRRFGVVDPTGAWWGVKSSSDGNKPGLPCVIFGGDHADVPLEPTAGEVLGDFAADPDQPSFVLDVSRFTRGEQIRFLTAFLARAYQKNRAPLLLVLDEADQVAPQQKDEKLENMLLGTAQRIVKLGRVKGFGVVLVTQRPASLNKNVLTQAAVLITLGLTAPQDHKAVLEWIRHQADEAQAREFLPSLATLERGEAWVWAPDLGVPLKRDAMFMSSTFDSSATPEHGVVAAPRVAAEVDLGKLHAAIQATIDRAKADDPKALRARIAELEEAQDSRVVGCLCDCHDMSAGFQDVHPTCVDCQRSMIEEAEAAALGGQALVDELREREAALLGDLDSILDELLVSHRAIRAAADQAVEGVSDAALKAARLHGLATRHRETAGRETEGRPPKPAALPRAPRPAPRGGGGEEAAPARVPTSTPRAEAWENGRGGPRQRILNALRELHDIGLRVPPRVQVAFFAGYTHARSKGFTNALGALRGEGLVDYSPPQDLVLTRAGHAQSIPVGRRRSAAELQADIMNLLGEQLSRPLRPLLKAHPRAVPRAELVRQAGWDHPRTKAFTNALGRLRTFGLVDYHGDSVRATDMLFVSR